MVNAHIHTPTAESTMQGDSQLHLDALTSNLPVTSQPTLLPELSRHGWAVTTVVTKQNRLLARFFIYFLWDIDKYLTSCTSVDEEPLVSIKSTL